MHQGRPAWGTIYHEYLAELQRRKQVKLFVWYERIGLLFCAFWAYDSIIGFKTVAWQQAIYWLGWALTAVAVIDLAWFFYVARWRQPIDK
jgi:hypothetical protein